MISQFIIILLVVSFFLIGIFKVKKINSIENYTSSKKTLNWFQISAGVSMTFAGGATLLNMASLSYTFGWYTLIDPLAFILGILIVLIFINFYIKNDGITLAQLLTSKDNYLSTLIGIITTFVFVLIVSAQLIAITKIIMPFFPNFSSSVIMLLISILIFSYVYLGGFSSVTKTDVFQLFVIILFLFIPILYFFTKNITLLEDAIFSTADFKTLPISVIVLLCIPVLFIPLSQDINIRIKSAIDKTNAKKGLILAAFVYLFIVISSTLIGITLAKSGINLEDSEKAFTTFFEVFFPEFSLFSSIVAMTIILSSLDSYSLNATTSLSHDILSKSKLLRNLEERDLIKIASIIIFVLTLSISLFFNSILSVILLALLTYLSLLLPIAIGKYLKLEEKVIFRLSIFLLFIILGIEIFNIEISFKAIIYPLMGVFIFLTVYLIKKGRS